MSRGRSPAAGRKTLDLSIHPLAFLAAAALICYGGPRLLQLGFYHDDWAILSKLHFSPPGLFARAAGLARAMDSFLFRPLDIPLYAALYTAFGLNPVPWQCLLLAINAALAWAAYAICARFEISKPMALLGAAVFLAYPNKDATMFWPMVMINSLSLLAFAAAYLAHLEYVAAGRSRSLLAAALLLVLSLGLYDQCFFLFPLWLIAPARTSSGGPRRVWLGAAAAALAVAAVAAYKFGLAPRLVAYNKTIMLSPERLLSVYRDGIAACLGPSLAAYVAGAARAAWSASPLMAAAALALPWLALTQEDKPLPASPIRRTALGLLGTGIFVLGYLPIALSNYIPTAINHMNRINQVPALGLVLVGVALAEGLGRVWAPRAVCGLAALLLTAHVAFAGSWAESYRRQLAVKDLVLAHVGDWPAKTVLLLMQPEEFVAGKAPVFIAPWDITGAAQVWTGDPNREAHVVTQRTDFVPQGVILEPGRAPVPYRSVRLLDAGRGAFIAKVEHTKFMRSP